MDPVAPLVPEPLPPQPKLKGLSLLAYGAIAAGVFLAFFRAWIWSYGIFTPETFGYAIGSMLLPALIAYAIATRKKVRNLNRFAFLFGSLCVFFFLITSTTPRPSLQAHIGDLMKQAAGSQPVQNTGPSEMDSLIRDFMRDVLDARKSHDAEMAKFDHDLGQLYTAESFSNKASIQHSLDAIRGATAVDQQWSRQFQDLPQRIKERADRSSLSGSDKQDIVQGFTKAFAGSDVLSVRKQATDVEKQWADATVDLYDFAMTNMAKLKIDGSAIVIKDNKARTEFNQKFEHSQTIRQSLGALNSRLNQLQRAAMQQSGVTAKDLGIKDDSQPAAH